jgi:NitT/TauT family transport system substrate-binding protein
MSTRRAFLAGAALAASLPPLRPAHAGEPLTVLTGLGMLPNFIEIMNTYSGGYFAKEGIEAKVLGANGTAREMQQMIAGQAEFGRVAALDQMNAIAKQNVPFVSIATICQGSTFHLVSLKEKPFRSAEELKGKTVGVVSVGGSTEMLLDLMLRKVGVARDEVKRESVGDNPGAVEFISRGRIDCFLTSLNSVVAIERAGTPIEYWSTDRYAPMPGQVYITTAEVIAKKPELVRHFLRALKASVDELLTQPVGPIFTRAAKDFDIPGLANLDAAVAVQKATAEKLWLADGKDNLLRNMPQRWQAGVETLRAAGLADLGDPAALYTNTFIDAALKG